MRRWGVKPRHTKGRSSMEMLKFWNSYLVPEWQNWSLCDVDCTLATPSNQCQESWHKELKTTRIPGLFRCSTEIVFSTALPQLVRLDAALIPSELNFSLDWAPPAMLQKALWLVDHHTTHIFAFESPKQQANQRASRQQKGPTHYYVLRTRDHLEGMIHAS